MIRLQLGVRLQIRYPQGPKTGIYKIAISIITPHIDLATDG